MLVIIHSESLFFKENFSTYLCIHSQLANIQPIYSILRLLSNYEGSTRRHARKLTCTKVPISSLNEIKTSQMQIFKVKIRDFKEQIKHFIVGYFRLYSSFVYCLIAICRHTITHRRRKKRIPFHQQKIKLKTK